MPDWSPELEAATQAARAAGETAPSFFGEAATFFVVRQGSGIVGSVGVERLDGDAAELHRLYLEADLRGRGTGQALVQGERELPGDVNQTREYRFERSV